MITTREIFLTINLQTLLLGAIEHLDSYGETIDFVEFIELSSIFPTLDIKYESTQEIAMAQMEWFSFPIMIQFKYDGTIALQREWCSFSYCSGR